MKKLVYSLAAAASVLALGACSDTPARKPKEAKPATTAAAVKPAAAASATGPALVYAYNPMGKRDPFRKPQDEVQRPDLATCADPLCQWDLDQLKLVAVVTGDANPLAMVQDPVGRGHVVRRNTRMGRQGGRVTEILRTSVTVTEYMSGVDGKVISNPVSLAIVDDDADKKTAAYDLLTGKNFGE